MFTKEEIYSRYEILLETYSKTVAIESKTLQEMLIKDFLPAVNSYAASAAKQAADKKARIPGLATDCEEALVCRLTEISNTITAGTAALKSATSEAESVTDMQKQAELFLTKVLPLMEELKTAANEAETKIPDELLP